MVSFRHRGEFDEQAARLRPRSRRALIHSLSIPTSKNGRHRTVDVAQGGSSASVGPGEEIAGVASGGAPDRKHEPPFFKLSYVRPRRSWSGTAFMPRLAPFLWSATGARLVGSWFTRLPVGPATIIARFWRASRTRSRVGSRPTRSRRAFVPRRDGQAPSIVA